MSTLNVLALNSGSSSLKFGLYRVDSTGVEPLLAQSVSAAEQPEPIHLIAGMLEDSGLPPVDAIGHRIVHGGTHLRQHVRVDYETLRQLQAAAALAPRHAPAALALMRSAQAQFPGLPQVACLDTEFHVGMPDVARVLPLARSLLPDVQRCGFHGLSLESIVRQLGDALPRRLVIAHLGHGASITAVLAGQSVDTSMGLTPNGGVVMGTRSGDLDPGVLVHLMRVKKLDADGLEAAVDQHAGLLGISGLSGDMQRLHEAATSNPEARLAVDMFCHSVRKHVAAMMAVLGGLDMLVFTGGIGENDALVRAQVCAGLGWAGISLDDSRNRASRNPVSDGASRCLVCAMASQENEQIARHAWGLLV